MKSNFLHSINWFRGIAILFVVLTHMPINNLMTNNYFHYWQAYFQNGTALFIFIAAYLFWHLIDRYEFRKYLIVKLKNVVTPYIVIITSTLIGIMFLASVGIHSIDYSSSDFKVNILSPFQENGFIWHYLKGGAVNYPLWFIPMIICFFVMSPFIKMISESKYFHPVLFISLFVTVLTTRGDWGYSNFIHYLGIWMLGIFCKRNEKWIFLHSRLIACISFLPSIIFVYFKVEYPESLINFSEIQKIFTIFFFLTVLMSFEKSKKEFKSLDILAKYSFGIFFIHYYFIVIYNFIFERYLPDHILISYWSVLILTLLSSLVVCISVKRYTKSYSRTLLGI
ncbi:acyltransferase family protein [Vibrio superstes]|uniref:acyltransferase family protein n=1 Tax=Vibrio superstes TaxID=198815 RepID=UPI000E5B382A